MKNDNVNGLVNSVVLILNVFTLSIVIITVYALYVINDKTISVITQVFVVILFLIAFDVVMSKILMSTLVDK